jgi:hypothetical protein
MSKQTAVKQLFDWIEANMHEDNFNVLSAKEKALAMEREQIKEGYIMALLDGDAKIRRDAEDYYNETYGGEK